MHQRLDIIDYNIIPIFLNFFNLTRLKPRQKLILYILINIFLTITIINCSLNNPGPDVAHTNESNNNYVISDRLSIYNQNVQGLIPFTELGKAHPNLDNTKICELHAYVYDKKPDVIILNETWLKGTILDGEILPTDKYKIFRCDRTDLSHPPDPENASKFKKNGGGVLIAVSCSLQLACSRISLTCKAELLAIEMIMNDTSKLVITTCYRVGTLGIRNCNEICNALAKLLRKKRVKKFSWLVISISEMPIGKQVQAPTMWNNCFLKNSLDLD